MSLDCDGDTLLVKVEQIGACHTRTLFLFYRELSKDGIKETSDKVFDERVYTPDKLKYLRNI